MRRGYTSVQLPDAQPYKSTMIDFVPTSFDGVIDLPGVLSSSDGTEPTAKVIDVC